MEEGEGNQKTNIFLRWERREGTGWASRLGSIRDGSELTLIAGVAEIEWKFFPLLPAGRDARRAALPALGLSVGVGAFFSPCLPVPW